MERRWDRSRNEDKEGGMMGRGLKAEIEKAQRSLQSALKNIK